MKTLIITLALLVTASTMDFADEQLQVKDYCQQVKLFKDTHGQQGWPAYSKEIRCD